MENEHVGRYRRFFLAERKVHPIFHKFDRFHDEVDGVSHYDFLGVRTGEERKLYHPAATSLHRWVRNGSSCMGVS